MPFRRVRALVCLVCVLTLALSAAVHTWCEASCAGTTARADMPSCHHKNSNGPSLSSADACADRDATFTNATSARPSGTTWIACVFPSGAAFFAPAPFTRFAASSHHAHSPPRAAPHQLRV